MLDKVQYQIYKDQLLRGFYEASTDHLNLITLHQNGDELDDTLICAMEELNAEGHFKVYIVKSLSWQIELAGYLPMTPWPIDWMLW